MSSTYTIDLNSLQDLVGRKFIFKYRVEMQITGTITSAEADSSNYLSLEVSKRFLESEEKLIRKIGVRVGEPNEGRITLYNEGYPFFEIDNNIVGTMLIF